MQKQMNYHKVYGTRIKEQNSGQFSTNERKDGDIIQYLLVSEQNVS